MKYVSLILSRLETDYQSICEELANLPAGSMTMHSGAILHKHQNQRDTITNNIRLQMQLCRKAYLKKVQQIMAFNRKLNITEMHRFKTYNPLAIIQGLPTVYSSKPLHYFFHQNARVFENTVWEDNPVESAFPLVETNGGKMVRSWGEAALINKVELFPLLFQVDVALQLGNRTIYPDFIIMEPFTGKKFTGEFFGLAGTAGYDESMETKMVEYKKYGYELGINLFYLFPADTKNPKILDELITELFYGGNF